MANEQYQWVLPAGSREIFEENVTRLLEGINKTIFRRTQKDTFECCAKCCDAPHTRSSELHECTDACAARMDDQRDYCQAEINKHRLSLDRCVENCKNEAHKIRQKGEIQESEKFFENCCENCAQEASLKLPQIIEETIVQMQERFINFSTPSNTD